MIDVAGGATGTDADGLAGRIHAYALHRRQVDHETFIDTAKAGAIMPPAADRDGELVLAAKIHRRDDVADIGAAGNEQGMLVDHAVIELARLLVFGMSGVQHRAALARRKITDGFGVHGCPPLG